MLFDLRKKYFLQFEQVDMWILPFHLFFQCFVEYSAHYDMKIIYKNSKFTKTIQSISNFKVKWNLKL